MADGDLNRGQAIAQSAAIAAMSEAYKVNQYQVGTWLRTAPKLTLRTRPGGDAEHYMIEFHVQHNPSKVRRVKVVLKEHHTGGMIPAQVVCYLGKDPSRKVFAGSLTIDGEIENWQQAHEMLNQYPAVS